MANRYWVGGTASWDGTAGTKWATTSGGAGGAAVPTASDDVFFTNLSTGTCTIASGNTGAKSINCTGFTGTITGTAAITVAGSVTLVAGMTYTHTGTMTFSSTGTLITAGKAFSTVVLNGAVMTLTLGDALNTSTRNITVTVGTFNTANYSVTSNAILSNNANFRTITLGSSTVTLRTLDFTTSTNLTFNANTSQINAVFFRGGSQTFRNVTLLSTENGREITGANTFNNLTLATAINLASLQCSIDSNQTVNGTFACGGVSAYERNFVRSNVVGTSRTITAAVISANNCDFRDITIAGAAAPISPTRAGDCGGNSGITFPAAKTVYRVGTNTNWIFVGAWSLTSGVTGTANDHPLPQDTAIINNATTAASLSINNGVNLPTLNLSTRTTAYTLTFVSSQNIYNSFTLNSSVTVAGTAAVTFAGRGTMVFTSAGKTITFPCIVDTIGTFRLGDALSLGSTLTTTLTRGTLDLNNFTLTTGLFASSNSNTRTLAFGTGNITLNGAGTVWNTGIATSLTTTGTQVVNVSNNTAAATIVSPGALSEANSISFNFTVGTYALTMTAGNWRSLNFTGYAGTVGNTDNTIYGSLNLGSTATYPGNINSWSFRSTSTGNTITTNGKEILFYLTFDGIGGSWTLQDALSIGTIRDLTHNNGTIDLNGKTLTVANAYITGTGTKNLTFNGGTLACAGSYQTTMFRNNFPTGFTTTAGIGTGTISLVGATGSRSFDGGGSTFNCTLNIGRTGALTIIGNNTFNNITNTVQPASVLFTAGTTTTFNNFNLNGTAGNLITIDSATAATHTLSKASGIVSVDYLSIKNSNATGGATWNPGTNSINAGGNTGWFPSALNNFLAFFN